MEWPDELVIQLVKASDIPYPVALLHVSDVIIRVAIDRRVHDCISEDALHLLIIREILPPTDKLLTYVLPNLEISGQRIPDLLLPVNRSLRDVDGLLGGEFFHHYYEFERIGQRVILRSPRQ